MSQEEEEDVAIEEDGEQIYRFSSSESDKEEYLEDHEDDD